MSVVTRPFSGFRGIHSNDRIDQNNFVCLRDADRIPDENRFVNVRSSETVLEHNPTSDDVWSGLEVDQTLGQLITAARKSRTLSREQVAEQTCIPAYYIRMIESDCYDAIPDQLYLLPFFERYANFLGLDAARIVSRFIRDFEKAEVEIVEAPAAPSPAAPNILQKWRRFAEAAVIVGILLPIVGWEIGTMRAAHPRQSVSSSSVAVSSVRPPLAIMTTDARPDTAAAASAQTSEAIATTADPSAVSQAGPPAQAQTTSRRRGHSHSTSRRSRHLKRRIS